MEQTWSARELPVLRAAVGLVDEMLAAGCYPDGRDIAARSGVDIQEVGVALNALADEYLEVQRTGGFEDWGVPRVTPAARRAAGQWPTAESLIEQLAEGLNEAAERESDPEKKSRLQAVGRELGGFGKAVAASVLSQIIGQHVPR